MRIRQCFVDQHGGGEKKHPAGRRAGPAGWMKIHHGAGDNTERVGHATNGIRWCSERVPSAPGRALGLAPAEADD